MPNDAGFTVTQAHHFDSAFVAAARRCEGTPLVATRPLREWALSRVLTWLFCCRGLSASVGQQQCCVSGRPQGVQAHNFVYVLGNPAAWQLCSIGMPSS